MSKLIFILSLIISAQATKAQQRQSDRPLSDRAIKEIIERYSFIADFNVYDETRNVGDEVFWRYSSILPRPKFKLDVNLDINDPKFKTQVPVTYGSSRVEEHINAGRVEFLKGNFKEAIDIWTAGHRRYLKKNSLSKRYSYFLGLAMLSQAQKEINSGAEWDSNDIKAMLYSVTTLYSKAFGLKDGIKDPEIDKFKIKALHNQAVIYYQYKRYPLALGIANKALRYQQQIGVTKKQSILRRIVAEVYIDAEEYLDAIRQYDLAIRQSENPVDAAYMFARSGDIYFSLNNFELAEDMYRLAIRVSRKKSILDPAQYILRGESLFWMGKFKDAQIMLNYGMMSAGSPKVEYDVGEDLQALAHIRIADASLALKENKKARLRYFQHIEQFRNKPTVPYAKLRLACLELPFYEGNNILHARELLDSYKNSEDILNPDAIEMAWTCEMASYAKTDRDPKLVARVRKFYEKYPNSKLLQALIEPVREVQSETINSLIDEKKYGETIDLYEKSKKTIYTKLSPKQQAGLFEAYVALYQSDKASPFAREYYENMKSPLENLIFLVGYAEIKDEETKIDLAQTYSVLREQLVDKPLDLDNTTSTRLLIKRLLRADDSNIIWISKLFMNWAVEDLDAYCEDIYSLLFSKKDSTKYRKYITGTTEFVINSRFNRILEKNPLCAKNYVALYMLLTNQAVFNDFLKEHENIPYNDDFLPLIWAFANEMINSGMQDEGRELLNKILNKTDKENKYNRFSKAKLETFESRYNNIWE